jgi:hypothetical protein
MRLSYAIGSDAKGNRRTARGGHKVSPSRESIRRICQQKMRLLSLPLIVKLLNH